MLLVLILKIARDKFRDFGVGLQVGHFINGKFTTPTEGFDSKNPANGEVLAQLSQGSQADVDAAVKAAYDEKFASASPEKEFNANKQPVTKPDSNLGTVGVPEPGKVYNTSQ